MFWGNGQIPLLWSLWNGNFISSIPPCKYFETFNLRRAAQADHPGRPAISLVLIVLVVYFTFPETKGKWKIISIYFRTRLTLAVSGLTLEEIKEVFGDGDSVNPAASEDYDPAEAKSDDAKVDIKDVPLTVTG